MHPGIPMAFIAPIATISDIHSTLLMALEREQPRHCGPDHPLKEKLTDLSCILRVEEQTSSVKATPPACCTVKGKIVESRPANMRYALMTQPSQKLRHLKKGCFIIYIYPGACFTIT